MPPLEKKVLAFATFLIAGGCGAEYRYEGIAAQAAEQLQQAWATQAALANERALALKLEILDMNTPRDFPFNAARTNGEAFSKLGHEFTSLRVEIAVGTYPPLRESARFAEQIQAELLSVIPGQDVTDTIRAFSPSDLNGSRGTVVESGALDGVLIVGPKDKNWSADGEKAASALIAFFESTSCCNPLQVSWAGEEGKVLVVVGEKPPTTIQAGGPVKIP